MSDGFDEVPAQPVAEVAADPAPVEVSAPPVEAPVIDTHESVLRRLMDRLEAIGQGLDSELSHWMQRARDIL